jgi:hypothetical protein
VVVRRQRVNVRTRYVGRGRSRLQIQTKLTLKSLEGKNNKGDLSIEGQIIQHSERRNMMLGWVRKLWLSCNFEVLKAK